MRSSSSARQLDLQDTVVAAIHYVQDAPLEADAVRVLKDDLCIAVSAAQHCRHAIRPRIVTANGRVQFVAVRNEFPA